MAYQIVWSADAVEDYLKVLAYISKEWNSLVVQGFVDKINDKLAIVTKNPFIGKMSGQDKNIRSVVITSHNKLYYQLYQETIEILNIFDTRQDAAKNNFE